MNIVPFIYDTKDELLSNTYLLIEDKKCVVVDPSSNYDGIVNYINKNNLRLLAVLLTHAHFDHIGGLERLMNAFKVKAYAGRDELETFKDPYLNCSSDYSFKGIVVNKEIEPLDDLDVLHFFKEDIICLATPYHTRGSISYYLKDSKLLFSGDSLFMYALGRDDLPTSVPSLRKSTVEKLMKLDDEVKVYPGHGRFTTIGNERRFIYRHGSF